MALQGEIIEIHGYNGAIGNAVEDLSVANADNAYLTGITEVPLDIISSDVKDDVAGVGGQLCRLSYLDINYDRQTVDIIMDGTTKVDVDASDIYRVNKLEVIRVGTELDNAGAITLTEDGGVGSKYLTVLAADNRSRCGYYYVPAGHKLAITNINIASHNTNAKVCTVSLCRQVLYGDDYVEQAFEVHTSETTTPYAAAIKYDQPIIVGSKCRVRLRGFAAAASSLVSAVAIGVLMPESRPV